MERTLVIWDQNIAIYEENIIKTLVLNTSDLSAENCSKLPKIAQNCRKLLEIAENCSKLPKIAQNCSKLPKIAQNCRKLLKVAENNYIT
jgi:hypothetical protein